MGNFFIECPSCGKYAEAKTGFFASKKIKCDCGHIINVKTEKLASKECPHCRNMVVFDQTKGENCLCPVCHEPINTVEMQSKLIEFSCGQCGVRLRTTKGASHYNCPVCDYENDVAQRIKQEEIKRDGLASIIKYEGDNQTLVWKHPIEDFNLGSQLIVHESQEAIFFKDGQALDLFGAGRYALETQQLPLIEKLYQLPTDTQGTFHSEVYYINLATQMGIKWGTDSKVRLFDPFSGLHLELGANGEFNIRVINSRKLLLKLVGTTDTLNQEQLIGGGKGYFRSMVMSQVKTFLAQTIKEQNINILEIDSHIMNLSNSLRERINMYLAEYGLMMPEFFINSIQTPDDDKNFAKMKEQYAQQYLLIRQEEIKAAEARAAAERKTIEAQTEARMKIIEAQGGAEAYRLRAEAEAAEMKMKGYTYSQETSRMVGMEAMQNGIISAEGGGVAGGLGDIASLGVTLGAMGGVMGMTKEAITPIFDGANLTSQAPLENKNTWDCTCGQKDIIGNFCNNCGNKKPVSDTWDCSCGNKGITGNFCNNCGAKKPVNDTWDCSCGNKGITGNFCNNCGAKKPENSTWDCSCGKKGITGNFCDNCGKKKGE